jgi:hypothetical protein
VGWLGCAMSMGWEDIWPCRGTRCEFQGGQAVLILALLGRVTRPGRANATVPATPAHSCRGTQCGKYPLPTLLLLSLFLPFSHPGLTASSFFPPSNPPSFLPSLPPSFHHHLFSLLHLLVGQVGITKEDGFVLR